MSDLDRLAETVREWQESGLVPGKEADAVLNVAPELIAVAQAAEAMRAAQKAEDTYGVEEVMDVERANVVLDAKLREVFGE